MGESKFNKFEQEQLSRAMELQGHMEASVIEQDKILLKTEKLWKLLNAEQRQRAADTTALHMRLEAVERRVTTAVTETFMPRVEAIEMQLVTALRAVLDGTRADIARLAKKV